MLKFKKTRIHGDLSMWIQLLMFRFLEGQYSLENL